MDVPIDSTEFLTEIVRARLRQHSLELKSTRKATKNTKMPRKIVLRPAYPPPSTDVIPLHQNTVSVKQGPRFLPQDYNDTAAAAGAKKEESGVEIYDYDRSKLSLDPPFFTPTSELQLQEDERRRARQLEGHESIVDLSSDGKGASTESTPTDPPPVETKCCGFSCLKYSVSKELDSNYEEQSKFLKYISIGYFMQLSAIIAWVALISLVDALGAEIKKGFNWAYLPLGLFFLTKAIIRTATQIRKISRGAQIMFVVIRLICIAYYCGAVKVSSDMLGSIISTCLCILLQTTAFFAWTANYVAYDMTNLEVAGIAAIVTFTFSVSMFIAWTCYAILQQTLMVSLVYNWLPSFVACELISVIVMVEIRQLVRGMRFPLTQEDWLFALLYI